ncbi:hypothetical protein, variant 1 [Verruconis gallopava]|uniref:DUF2415 domain-containing protein n=1 Tax=Verruconis gallopava TaxID=253628 RepID=A0A0D2AC19_9PEZI|nr:hypothetical protein, variant 1 [Verruconis gallopava]KIW04045.1 hypothetical protein, variant 1 [Verruconis gallopava]
MTPLPSPASGDDCGPSPFRDLAARTVPEQSKSPASVEDRARETLHGASSPTEEPSEWDISPWGLLNEGAAPSALRGQLLQLDLAPSIEQGTPSETPESRHPSLNRGRHGEDPYGPRARLFFAAHLSSTSSLLLPSHAEDAMDLSEANPQPTDTDGHPAAQRLASTVASWDVERPCRPNPNSSHDMALFLAAWLMEYQAGNVDSPISAEVMNVRGVPRPPVVLNTDVAVGSCDAQGVKWARFGTRASEVRHIRSRYHQHPQIRQFATPHAARRIPAAARTFLFSQTNTNARPWIEHYQLRNLLATTSHNDIHYVSRSKVMSFGSSNPLPTCVMDLSPSSDPFQATSDFHVTSLAAAGSALIAGGFRGEFAVQNLLSEFGTEPVIGFVSYDRHAITNHIHSFNSRSNGNPLAAFCSNDRHIRTLDVLSGRIVSSVPYDDVVNCSATSPNGRLRVLVGDFDGALIADADQGRILEHARGGSSGHGFACAWADNDIHVATAGQDCQVVVWDARNWSRPLAAIATENAHPTSLQFSPLGGGSPVLVVAESADVVNVVDARTYATKQVIEFFGDVAGTAISADGSQLIVANGDRHLGGVMTFLRHDFGVEFNDQAVGGSSRRRVSSQRSDWLQERRGLRLDDMLF